MLIVIHEIRLNGVYQFWVSAPENIDVLVLVQDYEKERGKYGFSYIKDNKQRLVVKDFINKNPLLKIKYKTWIEFELKKRMRTIKWLHFILGQLGVQVQYQTVARWVRGYSVPSAVVVEKIKRVFLQV